MRREAPAPARPQGQRQEERGMNEHRTPSFLSFLPLFWVRSPLPRIGSIAGYLCLKPIFQHRDNPSGPIIITFRPSRKFWPEIPISCSWKPSRRQLALPKLPIEVQRVLIYSEKHGNWYHPAKIEVITPQGCARFVLNVALTERGRAVMAQEIRALKVFV